MHNKGLECLATMSEKRFEGSMKFMMFFSIGNMLFGCACLLYTLAWAMLKVDPLNIVTTYGNEIRFLLIMGPSFFLHGRKGIDHISEYRFTRHLLLDLHYQGKYPDLSFDPPQKKRR